VSCSTGKVPYYSLSAAERKLESFKSGHVKYHHERRAYKCLECHKYHLTSQERRTVPRGELEPENVSTQPDTPEERKKVEDSWATYLGWDVNK